MELIIQYWDLILIVVCALVGVGYLAYKYMTLPTSKKKEKIREVLLDLVINAEMMYGSKQGRKKFEYVYGILSVRFIWLKFIPLEVIHDLVDECLITMHEMLEKNGGKE